MYYQKLITSVLTLLCTASASRGTTHGINGTTATLPYATFLGSISDAFPLSLRFLGVPYATPPLGDLRFRAPLSLDTTSSDNRVFNVTDYPDFCVQGTTGAGDAGGAGSEDCLKVNIYTPVNATANSTLPVLVYIHGGGYVYGNPANWPFDHWIQQSPNVVIVSVYYRLDAFGFLAHPEFDAPTADFQSPAPTTSLGTLNAGFLDQIAALRWIQSYISYFGGDPEKVTINGESAGGSSVELHLVAKTGVSENGKGALFDQAIAQSVFRTPLPKPEQQKRLFEFFASSAGCASGDVASRMACLRNASVSALARAQDNATSANFTGTYDAFHPVVDGNVFTDYPSRLIEEGEFRHVPIIVGSTTNETLSGGTDITSALETFFPSLSNASLEEFLEEFPASAFSTSDLRFQTVTGDAELRCARTIIGSASSKFTKQTFTYRYNTANPTSGDPSLVGHAAENWMMFLGTNTGFNGSTTFTPMNSTETAFASELIAYWLSFVRAGNPNSFKLARSPEWPSYSTSDRQRIVLTEGPDQMNNETEFTSGSTTEVEGRAETEQCEFIASKDLEEQA